MALNLLKFFLPKDRIFYSLFERAGINLYSLAEKLGQVVNESDYNVRASLILEMNSLEQENDALTHEIFTELGRNFITPFDREDIHSLATALDDIADYMYATAKKINFYNVEPTTDTGIQKSTEGIRIAVEAVNNAVSALRNLKNTQKIMESVIIIKNLEHAGDDLFDISIERLFASDVDAKELIKKREIYQVLEIVTDKCEDAANVIESIVVKYA
jgi:predicted phosphate transport protein (TIGR00153 family)